MEKKKLAIIGQGRSGRDIHGAFLLSEQNRYFQVRYIVERDERRRELSKDRYPGCEVLGDYTELFGRTDIDLVVNASFSDEHYPISLDLLRHGFNVLSEKPMARNHFECEELIRTAKEQGVLFTVFQNSMFAPYVTRLYEEAESGKFGSILEVKVRFSQLARRWDWQTLQKKMGGNAYNTGPHPIGIAAGLLGFSRDIRVLCSRLARTELTSGDADDFCKMLLTAPDAPLVDVEINSNDAFSDYNVRLLGTRGTYETSIHSYRAKYLVPEENETRPLQEHFLEDACGNPLYCHENARYHTESGTIDGDAFSVGAVRIYREIYDCLTQGTPMTYTAEDYTAIYRIIETLQAENPLGRIY